MSFNPQTIPAPGSGNSTMTITVGASTATGTYPITVTGNGGGIQQIATVTLTVTSSDGQQSFGFDFRNTANFVTDPPGDTYVLSTTAYPTKGSGVTYGWVKTSLVGARDRNAKLDPRLAGINYANNGSPATFYVDLPSAGTYNLSLAMGDAGYQQCWVQCQIQFLDGSTVLATVTEGATQPGLLLRCAGKQLVSSGVADEQPQPAGDAGGYATDDGSGNEQGDGGHHADRLSWEWRKSPVRRTSRFRRRRLR